MHPQVYQELLSVMQSRRGPYAGVDIPEFYALVKELFTPQEAEINNALLKKPETTKQIANRMGRDEKEITDLLEAMANKGLCSTFLIDGIVKL